MIRFGQWMEMANLFPQRKGDSMALTATTHMGFPVNSPTIFYTILNRDMDKYPDGMTAQEIADATLKTSTKRSNLRTGETEAPDDWELKIRNDKVLMSKFVRGINSMLAKSKDFTAVGIRNTGGRGRAPSVYHPTEDATQREGGTKFLKHVDREIWSKARAARQEKEKPIAKTSGDAENTVAVDVPDDLEGKSDEEIEDMFNNLFK